MAVVRAEGSCRRAGSSENYQFVDASIPLGLEEAVGCISYNEAASNLITSVSPHSHTQAHICVYRDTHMHSSCPKSNRANHHAMLFLQDIKTVVNTVKIPIATAGVLCLLKDLFRSSHASLSVSRPTDSKTTSFHLLSSNVHCYQEEQMSTEKPQGWAGLGSRRQEYGEGRTLAERPCES